MTKQTIGTLAGVWLLVACGKAEEGPVGPDSDGDGLSDTEEAYLGSNPEAADTDHDGWSDGDEVAGFTDPLNGYDHPYEGGWAIGACRDDLVGTGNGVGQVAVDFVLMDQHLDGVRLHDFCDRAVVIASAAQWCVPCLAEASFLQQMYERYASAGLMVLTLLGEDIDTNTPGPDVLEAWVNESGLTHPVLQDTAFSVTGAFVGNGASLPSTHLLSRGAVVSSVGLAEITEAQIIALLEQ